MRILSRFSKSPPIRSSARTDAGVVAKLDQIEAELAELRIASEVLMALAPTWITEALPFALAHGWTVRREPEALIFEHALRQDSCRIATPLADAGAQAEVQRDLHMRLGFVGPTGLRADLSGSATYGPRVENLRR